MAAMARIASSRGMAPVVAIWTSAASASPGPGIATSCGTAATAYMSACRPQPAGTHANANGWGMQPKEWHGQEGKAMQVEVYSACEAVRLYSNGHLLGEKPTTRKERFKAEFSVPYATGELKAVGLRGGKPVTECVLRTAGKSQIHVQPDRTTLPPTGRTWFSAREVTDSRGLVRPDAAQQIQFSVSGPAMLMAAGNGDVLARSLTPRPSMRVFHGRAWSSSKHASRHGWSHYLEGHRRGTGRWRGHGEEPGSAIGATGGARRSTHPTFSLRCTRISNPTSGAAPMKPAADLQQLRDDFIANFSRIGKNTTPGDAQLLRHPGRKLPRQAGTGDRHRDGLRRDADGTGIRAPTAAT